MTTRFVFGIPALLLATTLASAQVAPTPTDSAVPTAVTPTTAMATPPVATPVTELATSGIPAKVSTSLLNIRARPGLTYEVIGKFKMGEAVQVVGVLEDWYCVRVPVTVDAYVSGSFLDAAGQVNADLLKVRSGPGIMYNAYAMAKRGDALKRVGEQTADGWQRIEAPASAAAWVSKSYITLDQPGTVVPPVKEFIVAIKSTDDIAADLADAAGDQTEEASAAPKPSDLVTAKAADSATTTPPAATVAAGETATTTPDVPKVTAAPEPVTATTVMAQTLRDGTLSSLGVRGTDAATHLLSTQAGGKLVPQCYLISAKVNLNEWDGKVVRVWGREIRYSTWRLPVIEVTGVQTLSP